MRQNTINHGQLIQGLASGEAYNKSMIENLAGGHAQLSSRVENGEFMAP